MGFQSRNLLPPRTHAKPDRQHWEACIVDLNQKMDSVSSSLSKGQFTLSGFVTHSRPSLYSAAWLILFIHPAGVVFTSLDICPKK